MWILSPEALPSLSSTLPDLKVFGFHLHLYEYNASIEFYWAPFLLESNSDNAVVHRIADRIVRKGSIKKHGDFWKGTDDDLLPTYQNRYGRNARVSDPVMGDQQLLAPLHILECIIMTWNPKSKILNARHTTMSYAHLELNPMPSLGKEGLITELGKELRVSDDDHRELLSRVNNDDTIQRIREWRKANGPLSGGMSSSQPVHESLPSPTVSASRKKQKTGQSAGSLSVGPPPPLHSPLQPPPAALKRGPPTGGRGKKSKGLPYQAVAHAGRPLSVNRGSAFGVGEPAEAANSDSLIGRKVWTRWPADNNFYEAVIRDFKEGRHALVYDVNTQKEAWEWVNLKNISPQDIRWEGEDPGISQSGGRTGQGHGPKRPLVRGGAVGGIGRGRGTFKSSSKKDLFHPQNGIGRKGSADIELLHTDTLIKEVEKVFSGAHPDPTKVEKAKKVLKEHEQALIEAIARLEVPSDGESDDGDHPFPQGNAIDQDVAWRKQQYVEMRGVGRVCQGPDGDNARHALLEA